MAQKSCAAFGVLNESPEFQIKAGLNPPYMSREDMLVHDRHSVQSTSRFTNRLEWVADYFRADRFLLLVVDVVA